MNRISYLKPALIKQSLIVRPNYDRIPFSNPDQSSFMKQKAIQYTRSLHLAS